MEFKIFLVWFSLIISVKARTTPSVVEEARELNSTITEIPMITRQCEECKTCSVNLNFSNMNFRNIPVNFISSPDVKSLILQRNNLRKFELHTFESLPNLEYLDLSQNQLDVETYFSFGYHLELKSLILDHNCGVDNDCTIPIKKSGAPTTTTQRAIWRRTKYDIYGNVMYENPERLEPKKGKQLKSSDITFELPSLQYLSLRRSNIDNILVNLSEYFPSLQHLDVSQNNFGENIAQVLRSFPITLKTLKLVQTGLISMKIESLQNVEELNLDDNNFSILSSNSCGENTLCLQNYHKLKKLTLTKCLIKKIETDAFKDVSELEVLDISENQISEIANETFDYIPSLQYLNLSRNSLKSMPDVSVLKNLTQLFLDEMKDLSFFNSLAALKSLPSLKILSLRKNNIYHVPKEFLDQLSSLEELNLSGNNLISLPVWQSQSYLKKLDLSANKISDLINLPMDHFESLQELNLKNNSLTTIKMTYLKSLPDDVTLILE